MILFDWGTYNGLGKLKIAATLGLKLTEIPPRDLAYKRDPSYFDDYRSFSQKAFTSITAHAPYYNVVSVDKETMEKSWRGLIAGAEKAKRAGAEIYNLHLGWRAYMDHRDLDYAVEFFKRLTEKVPGIMISIEVPYTRRMLGDWEEIRHIREAVGEDKIIVSVQLENAWLYETGAGDTGLLEEANKVATKEFWMKMLDKALSLSHNYLSLRFSQIIAFALGRRILKKRTPLGKGYPDMEPVAGAMAEFLVKNIHRKALPLRAHIIYTGPPETKYKDTIALYAAIMQEATRHL
ncbi:MAG: TIM barrel protein [Desulfurococcales archaeon]|nr:TIM barrel protein [Desulfurococcales archaeon]